MLGDTISLVDTSSASVGTVSKINQDGYASEYLYRGTTSQIRLRVRHTVVKATAARPAYDRHNVEIVETIFATDTVPEFDRKAYIVFENLKSDSDTTIVEALTKFLQSGSSLATLVALYNWQS